MSKPMNLLERIPDSVATKVMAGLFFVFGVLLILLGVFSTGPLATDNSCGSMGCSNNPIQSVYLVISLVSIFSGIVFFSKGIKFWKEKYPNK